MAAIPSGTKFVGLSANYPTVEKRSRLINAESKSYTMQDLKFETSGQAVSFIVDKTESVSNQPNITYFKLGIDFGGLEFAEGTTYTLLIDRYRFAESKGKSKTYRQSRFYHESPAKAIENGRLSEVEITSNFQFLDFNQDKYFKFSEFDYTPKATGRGNKGVSRTYKAAFLNLGFRLRIDNGVDAPIETDYIGYVQMIAQNQNISDIWYAFVSYRY